VRAVTTAPQITEDFVATEYKYGFVIDIETESAPPGLNEDIIRLISKKKE
jgi:Fe-S cluster assembly protein SufB